MAVKWSQSASRVLAVLEKIAEYQPVGISQLVRLLDADKSAVQRRSPRLRVRIGFAPPPASRPAGKSPSASKWSLIPRLAAMTYATEREPRFKRYATKRASRCS